MRTRKPHLTCHPKDPRPFWVETGNPKTFRSYKRFSAAIRYAVKLAADAPAAEFATAVKAATAANKIGRKRCRPVPAAKLAARAAERAAIRELSETLDTDPDTALPPVRRFKVAGSRMTRHGLAAVERIIKARSKSAALDIFEETVANSTAVTARLLPGRPGRKAAKQKRSKAVLSSRRRAQRSKNETQVLRNAGLSERMAADALAAAAGPVRVAK